VKKRDPNDITLKKYRGPLRIEAEPRRIFGLTLFGLFGYVLRFVEQASDYRGNSYERTRPVEKADVEPGGCLYDDDSFFQYVVFPSSDVVLPALMSKATTKVIRDSKSLQFFLDNINESLEQYRLTVEILEETPKVADLLSAASKEGVMPAGASIVWSHGPLMRGFVMFPAGLAPVAANIAKATMIGTNRERSMAFLRGISKPVAA
jgi:hypothetical protein